MTRQEFIDGVTNWGELISFCGEYDIDICSDIFTDEMKDDYVDERLDEICDGSSWHEVLSTLQNIPDGYNYYIQREYWMEFDGVTDYDDEFYEHKNRVLEYMDEAVGWDGNNNEEQLVEDDEFDIGVAFEYVEESNEFEADTDVSLGDFFASSAEDLNKITAEAKAAEVKKDTNFNKFIQQTTAVSA